MDARTAVFALVSLRASGIGELAGKLPYAKTTVYSKVEGLVKDGLLVKIRGKTGPMVAVSDGWRPQKLKEACIRALSHGIDPEILLRDSTIAVWRSLNKERGVLAISKSAGISGKWARKVLGFLRRHGLVEYTCGKPIAAKKNGAHPLGPVLDSIAAGDNKKADVLRIPGAVSFEELLATPAEIEKALYEKMDEGLAVKETGFQLKGGGRRIWLVESAGGILSLESAFLKKLMTPAGTEDSCIRILASGRMDLGRLLILAKEAGIVKEVGCYLDIVNSLRPLVDKTVLRKFENDISGPKRAFLKSLRQHGKEGWEGPFEKRWKLDIHLDIGAMRHTLRAL
jgi:hypothetical protein